MVAVGSLGAGLVLGDPALAANGLPLALLVGVFAVPVWAWGLTCVGIPVWAVLHAGGVRDPRVAALVGAGLAFLVSVLLIHDMGGLRPFTTEPPWVQGALALAGAVAGWVTGRVAYDRPA